jgi:hypothetical protein
MGGHHLSLSLSRDLWNELLSAALPVRLAGDDIDLAGAARGAVRQLGVRQRVAGLLEDRNPPERLLRVKERAVSVWRRRKPGVYRRLGELLRVEGSWRVELDDFGTDLKYSKQRVQADAYVKGVAEGTVWLLKENVQFPFCVERRIGASVAVGNVHYDRSHEAVIGSLQDLGLYIGEGAVLQLLARLGEYALEQQLPRTNPVPILKRDQVEQMIGPMGGPLNMKMGVEDLELEITDEDMALKVRFGFSRAQLTDGEEAEKPGL